MKTLHLKTLVPNLSSNDAGLQLFLIIDKSFVNNEKVILQIDSDISMSSSFLNSSIGAFLEKYGLEKFKTHFKFKGSRTQYERFVNYINTYAETYLA